MDELTPLWQQIVDLVSPQVIIMYGAKYTLSGNDLREVNLCIVTDKEAAEIERKLYRELDSEIVFNLLVYGKAQWSTLVKDNTSYASKICQKGVVLYGKA